MPSLCQKKVTIKLGGFTSMSRFFTILMCVNRDDGFLDEAINSILNQTYQDFEFIIVANNCTDKLWNSLQNYNDNRIKCYRTNIGQLSFNLNYGLNISIGEYIVRMDADDISLSDRLENLNLQIDKNGKPDVIGTSVLFIDENSTILNKYTPPMKKFPQTIPFKNIFVHPTVAIKRATLIEEKGYLGGFQSEDYDLWIRLLRNKKYHLCNVDIVTLKYRISVNQSRGSRLPYAESASYCLREFLLKPRLIWLLGFMISSLKVFILPKK